MSSGNLRVSNFVPIKSYEEARAYYKSTAPIRNRVKSEVGVPLWKNRRNPFTYSLRLLNSGSASDSASGSASDTYALCLYNTPVVTFHSDGSITVDVGFNTNTTNEFANAFLWRYGFSFSTRHRLPVVTDRTRSAESEVAYAVKRPFQLLPKTRTGSVGSVGSVGSAGYVINTDSLERYVVQRVDRSIGAKARAAVRPLLEYAQTMRGLGILPESAVISMRGDGAYRYLAVACVTGMFAFYKNPDNFPKIVSAFYYRAYNFGEGGCELNHELLVKRVLDVAYTEFGAYYDEDVPLGTVVKNMKRKEGVTK